MYNLVTKKVKHCIFGIGTVKEQINGYIIVEFDNKTSKFCYPSAFEKFLTPTGTVDLPAIKKDLDDFKDEQESAKVAELAKKKDEEKMAKECKKIQYSRILAKNVTHSFNFEGGDILCKMGASWFTSYAYYQYVDETHLAWQQVATYPIRIDTYEASTKYHIFWLEQVLYMKNAKLSTNNLGLPGPTVKHMAEKVLENIKKSQS